MSIEVEHRIIPREGELACGDAVHARIEPSRALIAVIDALGHGPAAESVAVMAKRRFAEVSFEATPADVMLELDAALRGSRGAAVLVIRIELVDGRVAACTVGNVELRLVGSKLPLVSTPGIVGSGRLARLRVAEAELAPRERLIAYTDGVSARFDPKDFGPVGAPLLTAAEVCESLLARHRRSHDDATVLVADLERS